MNARRRVSVAAAVLAAALVWACAPVAFAVPSSFSWIGAGRLPAAGATVRGPVGLADDVVSSAAKLNTNSAQMTVDGVKYATTLSTGSGGYWVLAWVGPDSKGNYKTQYTWVTYPGTGYLATLTTYGGPLGVDGTHTISAAITDANGTTATDTWQYKVAVPPTLGLPSPANGSVVTQTPVISLPVSDNTAIGSAIATVNGVAVSPATIHVPAGLASGVVTFTPPALPNDATTTVSMTVFDASGNPASVSWSFGVQIYPAVSGSATNCVLCHPLAASSPDMGSNCSLCHSGQLDNPHQGAPSSYHGTAVLASDCRVCHVTALLAEHGRRTDSQGNAIGCMTCHGSTDPRVISAISTGNSACGACHTITDPQHQTDHTAVSLDASCTLCHNTSLQTEHASRGLTCSTCHASTDSKVVSAIAAGNATCGDCHTLTTPQHVADHTPVSLDTSCTLCHNTALQTEHANRGLNCLTCHASTDPKVVSAIAAGNATCGDCHTLTTPQHSADHTAVSLETSCTLCHDTSLQTEHANRGLTCLTCHASANPRVVSAIAAGNATCGDCHTLTTPQHSAQHTAVALDAGCVGCHSTSLQTEHANRGVTCVACHASTDSKVVAAIAAGNATCGDCHTLTTPQHSAQHTAVALDSTCVECHDTSLQTEHANRGLNCVTCHSSTDPKVVSAIASGNATCGDCHTLTTPQHLADHTPVALDATCLDCHNTSLQAEHASRGLVCATCHASTDPKVVSAIAAGNATCGDCHTLTTPQHSAQHTAVALDSTCVKCHDTSLQTEHSNRGLVCATCHKSTDPKVVSAIAAGNATCGDCHTLTTPQHSADHTAVSLDATCTLCHDTSLQTEHTNRGLNCTTCHSSTSPNVVAAIAAGNATCGDCHTLTTPQHAADHTAALPDTGCEVCHSQSLPTEHINRGLTCATCHASVDPQVTGAISAGNATCNSCHVLSNNGAHYALHATTIDPSCTGSICHATTNLVDLHVNSNTTLSCGTCHFSTDARVVSAIASDDTSCTACHDFATAHGNVSAAHESTNTSAFISAGLNDPVHSPDTGMEVSCSQCHITNLVTLHVNDCQACHSSTDPSVKLAISTGNRNCTACHANVHLGNNPSHNDIYDNGGYAEGALGENCYCHEDNGAAWTDPPAYCSDCHPQAAPAPSPTTTSDARVSYSGTATITLTANDNVPAAIGISATYYSLDGGAVATGTVIVVGPPASGAVVHTLRFWSTDFSGHTETTKSATFSVGGDTTPPVTTSDATSTYIGLAVIHFSATDNVPGGVAATHYTVDGAATQTGATAIVSQPTTSGPAAHTLRFWSVDVSGNIETAHAVSFTITADHVAPHTTATVPRYLGIGSSNLVVTLSPSDPAPSSGIANSFVNVDGSAASALGSNTWQASGLVPGDHTVTYWSADNAGNTEAANHATTTVDWTAPSTSSNATGSYTGTAVITLTPTDNTGAGVSGLAHTYFTVDGGAQQSGTTITIAAPGSGSATHTVAFWSVDNAGNVEGTHSVTVRVSAAGVTYTLTYTAGANGTISGTSPQNVAPGGSGTAVTAVANTGYHFVNWSDASTANPRTDTNVSGNKSVTANFAINTYTLKYAAGANGSLSGTTSQTVNYNGSGSAVTANPATGYHFVSWSDSSTANPRTDTLVKANVNVTATFAINTYTLTYTAGSGGTVSGTSPQTVNYNGSGSAVTAVANSGYAFVKWSDGSTANPRTDTNVTASLSVSASFAPTGNQASFAFTGAPQTFTVPAGVHSVYVTLLGGAGGDGNAGSGGMGGEAADTISVTPGQTLTIRVGGRGQDDPGDGSGGHGGWPNGGNGDQGGGYSAGGGGSSTVWLGTTILAEAGGAGGAGDNNFGADGGAAGSGAQDASHGFQTGGTGIANGGGGGGGWNAGAGSDGWVNGSDAFGGTSHIAVGSGSVLAGVNGAAGSVVINW